MLCLAFSCEVMTTVRIENLLPASVTLCSLNLYIHRCNVRCFDILLRVFPFPSLCSVDHTRVILIDKVASDSTSDYINANHIQVYLRSLVQLEQCTVGSLLLLYRFTMVINDMSLA